MRTSHRHPRSVLCLIVLTLPFLGCALPTPRADQVPVTVVVTATERSGTPAAPPVPATAVPPTATPVPPTWTPTSPAPTPQPTAGPTAVAGPKYDSRESPVDLLASYINAINRREYLRAWNYWESAPNPSYEDFAAGYATTDSVFLVLNPSTFVGAAAGSMYQSVPVLLIARHTDGSQHNFVGCYVTRRTNPEMDPASAGWSLYSATVSPTPANSSNATLLAEACEPLVGNVSSDDRTTPFNLLASYLDAINRKEYGRAWAYWETPPNPSYDDFVAGYADTVGVLVAVAPPARVGAAAGSAYAEMRTMLIATHLDGTQHSFVGCYVARRSDPSLDPASPGWSIYSATVVATPGNTTDAITLAGECPRE